MTTKSEKLSKITKNIPSTSATRRSLLQGSAYFAAVSMLGRFSPMANAADGNSVKIGFLAPLTGEVAAWGKPGLDGCRIWVEWINENGGVAIGSRSLPIEIIPYDNEYDPSKARAGAVKLISEDKVKFIMMLGGDTWAGVESVAERTQMLFSTLLPSDLTPETKTLIAPAEVHPIYNVTAVEWLAENKPDLKTAVICAQDDALGLPSVATYLAAFEAGGIKVLEKPLLFDAATTDFAPVVARLLATKPDIVCLDTCYSDYVHPICEQLYQKRFKGQIISCTADFYEALIKKTSKEFMEGFLFQFPDFDDPKLKSRKINFKSPKKFYKEYNRRHPGEWGAVSWEYASILDLWKSAAERVDSVNPIKVLEGMKRGGKGLHAFGTATWWGEDLFGINNALVGNWPVVAIENGKAVIKEFRNIPKWYNKNGKLLIKHMEDYKQMYYQRG